ncbi:MAG TPA: ligase-associated DNA damage response exonuclease [Isosphaeraceae bacterium]
MAEPLLRVTESGLYCEAGDFVVDPWRPVDRAVVTHAHSDHACRGCRSYLTSTRGAGVLGLRVGPDSRIDTLAPGRTLDINGVALSLHPAGHILGSSQVRLEHRGEVWVASGDYKVEPDPTCDPFEPVRCRTFISESTFGLPIYRWERETAVFEAVNSWWRSNRDHGRASLLFGYALGKAQRLLAGIDSTIGPIYTHGAVEPMNRAYREAGVNLPTTIYAGSMPKDTDCAGALIVAPPSANGSPWARKFGPTSTAFASGWMRIRGPRRRRSVDRGFVLSDHCDWPGLLGAIEATGAERVLLTHGYTAVVAQYLRERGVDAATLATHYEGERDDAPEDVASESEAVE